MCMKTLHSISLLVLLLAIVGCSGPTGGVTSRLNRDAKAAGSPIRFKSEKQGGQTVSLKVLIDLPSGETKANETVKKYILSKIEPVESSKGRGAPQIEAIRLMPDCREVCVLTNMRFGIAYVIDMEPSPQGGTDFTVVGPEQYAR